MKDLILVNAHILTMVPENPRAEAIVISGERITFVGNRQDAERFATADAETIDLEGKTVIPGFNDNHLHTIPFGHHLSVPDLTGLDRERIIDTVKDYYREAKPGELILAYRWDYTSCPDPHKSILDKAFPKNPVILVQFSGHGLWLNTRALNMMGISKTAGDVPGRTVLRDEDGEPTGIIREMSINSFIEKYFRKINRNKKRAIPVILQSMSTFNGHGITSVQDNTWFSKSVKTFEDLLADGRLTCRVSCWAYGENRLASFLLRLRSPRPPWVTLGPDKFFLDGTFSARSAWLTEPYQNEPENYGSGRTAADITKLLRPVVKRRRQAAFHAIGDRTIKEFLDAVEKLSEEYPYIPELRLRLEHAQLIRPEDISRIRELGILIASQPSALEDPLKDAGLLGEQRALNAYPYRSLLNEGVSLSFGSDVPGERNVDPLTSLHYAVNREGKEAISAEEGLRCYTTGSAYAEFGEEEKGRITAAKLADLTVLSDDPTTIEKTRIKDISVEMTIVGGNIVYRNNEKSH